MKPLFLGGQPAIDFLNTALTPDGEAVETIPDGRAFLEWLVGAGLVSEAEAAKLSRRFGGKGLDTAAAEARKVREWARDWLARWRVRPGADYADEIAALNKLLAREASTHELVATKDGMTARGAPAARIATSVDKPRGHATREAAGDRRCLVDPGLRRNGLHTDVHRPNEGASATVLQCVGLRKSRQGGGVPKPSARLIARLSKIGNPIRLIFEQPLNGAAA